MSENMKEEKEFRLQKKSKPRYFDLATNEDKGKHIKTKLGKVHQRFKGKVIKVEQDKLIPWHQASKLKKGAGAKRTQVRKPIIPKALLQKYSHGPKVSKEGIKTNFFKQKQERKEHKFHYATEQAARSELLLKEQQGFIQPDDEEITDSYRQDEIVKNVDILAASKRFKLNLDFGPYAMRYTKNGRHLLLGGRRGHVTAFDWITKKLYCEINVMEEVADVSWLHVHTMFACAQKKWVYIYDNQGTELHCVKRLNNVNRMEFLPYHFLLATANTHGYLSWLDVSIGELVGNYTTGLGDIRLMKQNPGNGVLCLGGGKGVVSMWSPKMRDPLATMLCHATPMSALAVDPKGIHLATAGLDCKTKIWDVRELSGPLAVYKTRMPANNIEVSQRGVLALSQGTHCEVYKNYLIGKIEGHPYLHHNCEGFVHGMQFCPYEDILGVATAKGFESLLVPGSGEPNFDALEDNPYQSKSQRREHEVHALLEKIPPEFITLDSRDIIGIDVPTLQEKLDAKRSMFFVKPPQIKINISHKMKGRGGTAKAARNKQIVKDTKRKDFIKELRESKKAVVDEFKKDTADSNPLNEHLPAVLHRFTGKRKK